MAGKHARLCPGCDEALGAEGIHSTGSASCAQDTHTLEAVLFRRMADEVGDTEAQTWLSMVKMLGIPRSARWTVLAMMHGAWVKGRSTVEDRGNVPDAS